ncbi:MAG: TonB-dependent receptor [Acidobacteriota bacterium]
MGRLSIVIATILAVSLPAWPQASTTTVSGTVHDQSAAVIPNVTVELTNTATGVALRTNTNQVGFYMFPGVRPGPYRLAIEAPGMEKFEAVLTVQVQQAVVVDPVLKPGAITATVEVRDVTPMIVSSSPTLGHVLEQERIEQLPINGRSVESLLVTVPGMEGLRAYGQRAGTHDMVLDGTPLMNRVWGNNLLRLPGLDTIQEFKVEVNNSSAKFTRPTTIVMATKGGTNQFHGAVFETHRNNAFGKARTRTDYYAKPPQLIRNEFGASSGGPLVKNRTFWFFAYEAQRQVSAVTQGRSVPTEAMRRGDLSGLVDSQGRLQRLYDPWTTDAATWSRQPFSYGGRINVIDPRRLSPVAKYLFDITPLPTLPEINPLVDNNWWGPVPTRNRDWTITTRFDHRFTDNDQFYGRLTRGSRYREFPEFGVPSLGFEANYDKETAPNFSLVLSWVRTFSPTFFNEVLLSGSHENWWYRSYDERNFATQMGLPNPFNATGFPRIYTTGLNGWVFYSPNTRDTANTYYLVDDNATKITGNHTLQFGVHLRKDYVNNLPDQQQVSGTPVPATYGTALYDPSTSRTNPLSTPYTGHQLGSLYIGSMQYSNRFIRRYWYLRYQEYALYFQDDFKVTPRLTLNLGLRWDYWPAYAEKFNTWIGFDRDKRAAVLGTDIETFYALGHTYPSIVRKFQQLGGKLVSHKDVGLPPNLMYDNKKNLGPRFGFAWRSPFGARPLVLRGGYRISYFAVPARVAAGNQRSNSPAHAFFYYDLDNSAYSPDALPAYNLRTVPAVIAGVNSKDVIDVQKDPAIVRGEPQFSYMRPRQPDPRAHDWNLTLEKEVMADTVARVAYVGNHTTGLDQFYRYNEATPAYIWYVTTGTPLPTGEYSGVARRPYDQVVYGRLEEYAKTGWSNYSGIQLELERRYSKGYGYQIFYNMNNALAAGALFTDWGFEIPELNTYLPGRVPADIKERNRFLNYRRDTTTPKHRVRWNWIVDLPIGQGKWLAGAGSRWLDKIVGGWQVAGMGWLRSNYFDLPTGTYPTGENVEIYGYKYPIQDCRGGACRPGYLWWNGYLPANQINSVDARGNPNGVMGVPENYKPATQPLIPWPKVPDPRDPMYSYYGSNTVWVPLKTGIQQRIAFDDNLHPWRNQYLPGVRQWGLDASLFKRVAITERVSARINVDLFNVFNHPNNPNDIGGTGILSTRSSGSGARELQLTVRLTW